MKANISIREAQLNAILDKMNSGQKLSSKERSLLDLFSQLEDDIFQDFRLISKSRTLDTISNLLDIDVDVICNLCDKQGPIDEKIYDVQDDILILLRNDQHIKLEDRFLYDIIYNPKRMCYSLECTNEYFEEALINNTSQ